MEIEQTLNRPLIPSDEDGDIESSGLNEDVKRTDVASRSSGTTKNTDSNVPKGAERRDVASMVTIALLVVVFLGVGVISGYYKAHTLAILLFILFGGWFAVIQTKYLFVNNKGTSRMQKVATWIQQGSQGFFKTQYRSIAFIAIIVSCILFFGFLMRPMPENKLQNLTTLSFATITTASFLTGCVCSCVAGYIGLWISINTNSRVASAATVSYKQSIKIAMQGGMIASIVVVTLVIAGILLLYFILDNIVIGAEFSDQHSNDIPSLLVVRIKLIVFQLLACISKIPF